MPGICLSYRSGSARVMEAEVAYGGSGQSKRVCELHVPVLPNTSAGASFGRACRGPGSSSRAGSTLSALWISRRCRVSMLGDPSVRAVAPRRSSLSRKQTVGRRTLRAATPGRAGLPSQSTPRAIPATASFPTRGPARLEKEAPRRGSGGGAPRGTTSASRRAHPSGTGLRRSRVSCDGPGRQERRRSRERRQSGPPVCSDTSGRGCCRPRGGGHDHQRGRLYARGGGQRTEVYEGG